MKMKINYNLSFKDLYQIDGLKKIDSDVKKEVSDAADYAQECPEPEISELHTNILLEI